MSLANLEYLRCKQQSVCCKLQSFDSKYLSFCGRFRPYVPLWQQELVGGDEDVPRSLLVVFISGQAFFNFFSFYFKELQKGIFLLKRREIYDLENLELRVRNCVMLTTCLFDAYISMHTCNYDKLQLHYDIIASVFSRKKDSG